MPPVVSARLLGIPQVRIDGAPPPPDLIWRKHLALCVVLWVAPERRRSRDQLIGLLWSEKAEQSARHSLNEALRVVRRATGPEAITSTVDYVQWNGRLDLDTDRFASFEHQQPAQAAALVTGPFCDGLVVPRASEFESWLMAERDRWTVRTVDILLRAGSAAENRGDLRTAIDLAQRAATLKPMSALAAQATVRAHWLNGDRLAALAAGEAYRVRLANDLGLELDAQTAALLTRIGRGEAGIVPVAALKPDRRPPFLARENILERLLDEWRSVSSMSRARLLVIAGQSGTGRSRLLEELLVRAAVTGSTIASMRAVEADANDPEAALIGLARSGLELAPGVATAPGGALAAFAKCIPAWEERFGRVEADEVFEMGAAFEAIVEALAVEQPLVLAIDDADRLHPDELRWLMALLRSGSELDVTLIVTVRSGSDALATDELTRRAGRDMAGLAIRLEPLAAAEMRPLVDWATPAWSEAARDRLTRRLQSESGGLLSVAVDVLNMIRAEVMPEHTTPWPAADRTLDATLPGSLPEPLVAAVRVAFRSLEPDAQRILVAASLLAEPFSAEQVGRVAEIEDAATRDAALDRLEWDAWIVADGRGYLFPARAKRTLIAAELTTPGQRRRLRERIAALTA